MANNGKPDVGVRLSAEGMDEVIKAFRIVQHEAERIGKGSNIASGGVAALRGQVASLVDLLPALTAGAAIVGFVALTKSALDTAAGLGELEKKTGVSVETLSTLSFAARTASIDQETLGKNLAKASKFFDEYDRGAQDARDAVTRLFGSSKALEGLNTDAKLLKTVDALGKLEPGARRTALAMQIFGKGGAELLPLIDNLADGGFDKLKAKAEQLGLVMSGETAAAALELKENLKDVESAAEGAANQFLQGFGPDLSDTLKAVVNLIAGPNDSGVSAMTILGQASGKTLKFIVVGFGLIILSIVDGISKIAELVLAIAAIPSVVIAMRGDVVGAIKSIFSQVKQDFATTDAFIAQKEAALLGAFDSEGLTAQGKASTKKKKKSDNSENEKAAQDKLKTAQKVADALLKLQTSSLEAELAVLKANNKAKDAEEKRAFDQGLTNLDTFFKSRAQRINAEAEQEIALLQQKQHAIEEAIVKADTRPLAKGETEGERTAKVLELGAQLKKADADLEARRIQQKADVAANTGEQIDAARQLSVEQLNANADIEQAEGHRFAAERLALEAQIAGLQRLKGETDIAFAARKGDLSRAGNQSIDFAEITDAGKRALDALATQRQQIIDKVNAGQVTTLGGEQQLRELELKRLPVLQAIAAQMQAAAITPDQIQAAKDFAASVSQIQVATEQNIGGMTSFKQASEDAFGQSLFKFLTDDIDHVHSVGDAFRQLGLDIASSLRQWAAQMLVNLIILKLLKAAAGFVGGGGGGGGTVGDAGGVSGPLGGDGGVNAAGGGLILGPGTSTSDSIRAWLSNGEFVVRSAVVREPGVLQFLKDLNASGMGSVRRRGNAFAQGGLVTLADQSNSAGSGSGRAGLSAILDVDPALLLKRLEATPEWGRVHVRTADNNRKAMQAALGH
jgi:hypothetical protein